MIGVLGRRAFVARFTMKSTARQRDLPSFSVALERLPLRVGEETVDAVLEEIVRAAIGFYRQAIPLFAAVLMEPELRQGTKNALKGSDAGPRRWRQPVEAYLRAEQRLKRVDPGVDVGEVASLLLARSFQHAFASLVSGDGSARGDAAVARSAASTVLQGCRG